MDDLIFGQLLAERLGTDPKQFELVGGEVKWFDPDKNNKPVTAPNESPYDTPENRAIVADVKANYETLKLPVIKENKLVKIRSDAKTAIETPYPDWYQRNIGMGVFTEEQIPEVEACKAYIASVRQESNRCEALVNAALSEAEVDAVTPVWPTV